MDQQNKDALQNGDLRDNVSAHNNQNNQSAGHDAPNALPRPPRRAEDMEYYRNFLEQLLDLMCNGDQATVSQMVSIIRSGASHEEILARLAEFSERISHSAGGGRPQGQNTRR